MNIEIKTFSYSSDEYQQALKLREEVLRKPLGIQFTDEELEKDKTDIHFGLFVEGEIRACLILSDSGKGKMKMRQVAVKGITQGRGLGRQLSQAAEQYALEHGFERIFCHSRKTAVPFYKSLGYYITGEEFLEINIPHLLMEKKLL